MSDTQNPGPNDYGALSCSLLTVTTWLAQRRIDPETVSVTVNDAPVPRDLWDQVNIRQHDRVRTHTAGSDSGTASSSAGRT